MKGGRPVRALATRSVPPRQTQRVVVMRASLTDCRREPRPLAVSECRCIAFPSSLFMLPVFGRQSQATTRVQNKEDYRVAHAKAPQPSRRLQVSESMRIIRASGPPGIGVEVRKRGGVKSRRTQTFRFPRNESDNTSENRRRVSGNQRGGMAKVNREAAHSL